MTNPSLKNQRWSRDQIRAVRIVSLVPLFQKRGLQLIPREAGNYILPAYPGLIVKNGYWRWPERNLYGNAIDFHVQVLGMSFVSVTRSTSVGGCISVVAFCYDEYAKVSRGGSQD